MSQLYRDPEEEYLLLELHLRHYRKKIPDITVPATTVPTPVTLNVSLILYSKGWVESNFSADLFPCNRFKNVFTRSNPIPDTFETWKTGQILYFHTN
jgi:hypothetical protein